jgi:hypothetical protein
MNEDWYEIKDFDGFVEHSRQIIFKIFAQPEDINEDDLSQILTDALTSTEKDELERLLTFSECDTIIKQSAKTKQNKKTKNIHYYVNDKLLHHIMEELNSRLVSNILHKLVCDGVLDTAFDSDKNDFIFWIKESNIDDEKSKTDSPETD